MEITHVIRNKLLLAVGAVMALAVQGTSVNALSTTEYIIKEGDYLDKVAIEHGTTWDRLYNKNLHITNPDLVFVGDKIVIPAADEVIEARTVTAPVAPAIITPAPVESTTPVQNSVTAAPVAPQRAFVPGNAYAYGYCTWYVKNIRGDIGNYWGDGSNWLYAAQAEGYATGSVPAAGAIGVARGYNHVVYVNSVNGNGTVNISEMNYEGWNIASSRTASAHEFNYIY